VHRQNLNTFSSSELAELADLIRTHVTQSVLDEHHAWHNIHGPGGTRGPGSGERFLAFHRNFIGKLEDNLISQGKNKFVPLSTWDPKDPIPQEFSHPGRSTSNPAIQLPTWAKTSGADVGLLLAEGLKDLLYSLIQYSLLIPRSRILGQEAQEREPFPLGNVKEFLHSPRGPAIVDTDLTQFHGQSLPFDPFRYIIRVHRGGFFQDRSQS